MTTTDHLITYSVYSLRLLCRCDTSIRRTEAELTRHLLDAGRDEGRRERESLGAADWRDGYDVGLAAAMGEPVAADDPRIKPGARVRVEFDTTNGVTAHEGVVVGWDPYRNGDVRLIAANTYVQSATRVYLLAEAPDPDAEVLKALASVIGNGDPDTHSDDFLAALRAAGFDVVKAVAK